MARRSEADVVNDFDQRSRALLGQASDPEVSLDGRTAIRLRNREKVIQSLIELISEGRAATVDEIVERSGVARRTIFRHFGDLSDLLLAAMRTVITDLAPLSILKDPGEGPLDERIDSFVDSRLRTLALMHPFRTGMNHRVVDTDAIKAGLRATAEMISVQIATHFANELASVSPDEAKQLVDAIFVVSSYESYDVLVAQFGRSVESVRSTWVDAIGRLLDPAPVR